MQLDKQGELILILSLLIIREQGESIELDLLLYRQVLYLLT